MAISYTCLLSSPEQIISDLVEPLADPGHRLFILDFLLNRVFHQRGEGDAEAQLTARYRNHGVGENDVPDFAGIFNVPFNQFEEMRAIINRTWQETASELAGRYAALGAPRLAAQSHPARPQGDVPPVEEVLSAPSADGSSISALTDTMLVQAGPAIRDLAALAPQEAPALSAGEAIKERVSVGYHVSEDTPTQSE
jgi:hypothetical protein